MSPLVESVTHILSLATVFGGALALFLLFAAFKEKPAENSDADAVWKLLGFFKDRALIFSFLIALIAMIVSLFYSDIVGFVPCVLCWWQRIFLYPQVVILGVALSNKSKKWWQYTIPLSVIGGAISIYNSYLQFGGSSLVPCAANGSSDCAHVYFMEYGYVTIPTMALTGFVLLLLLGILARRRESEEI
ncbi:MAG: disulfide bond formation protein B [Patescibacteria group bacterium]|nr:disulfide bond formation protein B [Patescibacteria group bacterium]MDE2015789.1 disulfide bond formation protein B [Patescibacteria group bacterium]MDE2226846.1 disulfide bond formation protein B [Patescibacteria group bacterium]